MRISDVSSDVCSSDLGAGAIMAEWILEGRPSLDLWPLDIRRFSFLHGTRAFMVPRAVEHYAHHYKLRYPGQESEVARGLRRSPLYEILKIGGASCRERVCQYV